MIERTPGAFPQALPNPTNVLDQITSSVVNSAAWTEGATTVAQIGTPGLTTQINQKYTLSSISVTASLFIELPSAAASYGKLGKIIAGLVLDNSVTPTPSSTNTQFYPGGHPAPPPPYVSPMLPLPSDNSLVATLFDPASDDLPPVMTFPGISPSQPMKPLSCTISPPVPIETIPGDTPMVGIWMTPSLLGCQFTGIIALGMVVCNAKFQTVYDNGL